YFWQYATPWITWFDVWIDKTGENMIMCTYLLDTIQRLIILFICLTPYMVRDSRHCQQITFICSIYKNLSLVYITCFCLNSYNFILLFLYPPFPQNQAIIHCYRNTCLF